jgi:hypothetical protein
MSSIISGLPLASPDVLSGPPSAQLLLVLKFYQAFNALDASGVLACFSDENFVLQILPEETFKGMGRITVADKTIIQQELAKVAGILKTPGVCPFLLWRLSQAYLRIIPLV